ncbi:MAG: hypothetical protein U0168_14830 [Nannocystaceae bacterium]
MSGSGTDSMTATIADTSAGPSSSSGPTGCNNSDECTDPAAPICVGDTCMPCTADDQCSEKSSAAPACQSAGELAGHCVQCTALNDNACEGNSPVCDDGTSSCVGCSFHEQCPDSACRIATGGCFDPGQVFTVGNGGDYSSIDQAVTILGGGDEIVLRVISGPDFNQTVTVSGAGTAYALLDDDPSDMVLPQWINSMDAAATLRVESGAEVYVQGLRLALNGNAAHAAVEVDDASVYLDRTAVVSNNGGGIALTGGAYALVRNCFVGGNGNQFQAHHGVSATDSTLDIVYTSVVANDGNGADSLACTGSGGTVRNSILLGSDTDSVDCPGVSLSENALDAALAGNTNVGALNAGWFAGLPDDLHLQPAGKAEVWRHRAVAVRRPTRRHRRRRPPQQRRRRGRRRRRHRPLERP